MVLCREGRVRKEDVLFTCRARHLLLGVVGPSRTSTILSFCVQSGRLFRGFRPSQVPGFCAHRFRERVLLFRCGVTMRKALFQFCMCRGRRPRHVVKAVYMRRVAHKFSRRYRIKCGFSDTCRRHKCTARSLHFVVSLIFQSLGLRHTVT